MPSENIQDWDQPIPTPIEASEDIESKLTFQERRQVENLEKLKKYVELQAYQPVQPPLAAAYTENLAKPRPRTIIDNSKQFPKFMVPEERGERLKRIAAKYTTITTEQFEQDIRSKKVKDRQKEDILKRRQEVYYDMLTKMEHQCRTQYLNVLINKFGNFIAKLATTMRIPSTLVDPYARMQRGIFCNILRAIGVQPSNQAAIYYNTKAGSEYEVCHKLSHALLSLIIKALDSASTHNPQEEQPIEINFDMDDYIKDRLMCAAEKKIQNTQHSTKRDMGQFQKKRTFCVPELYTTISE